MIFWDRMYKRRRMGAHAKYSATRRWELRRETPNVHSFSLDPIFGMENTGWYVWYGLIFTSEKRRSPRCKWDLCRSIRGIFWSAFYGIVHGLSLLSSSCFINCKLIPFVLLRKVLKIGSGGCTTRMVFPLKQYLYHFSAEASSLLTKGFSNFVGAEKLVTFFCPSLFTENTVNAANSFERSTLSVLYLRQ